MVKENWILLNFVYVYNFENLFNIQKKKQQNNVALSIYKRSLFNV